MTIVRMDPDERRAQLVTTGLKIAQAVGWRKVTKKAVAEELSIAPSLINVYWETERDPKTDKVTARGKDEFLHAIMVEAVRKGVVKVVAEGLLYQDEAALEADYALYTKAQAYIKKHKLRLPRWRTVTESGVVHAWA